LEVEVADDNEALLTLYELGEGAEANGGRSLKGGNTVFFSFPGVGRKMDDPDLGLGSDSVYEFDQDGGEADETEPESGLLRIENMGTQSVAVYSEFPTDSEIDVSLYDVTSSDKTALRNDPTMLDVGESVDVGFRIRTSGADTGEFEETMTIVADQPAE
jgi:hypothetical protein